jgi:hypothetical protein
MARVLHLFTGKDASLASTVIAGQLEAGDAVTIVLLHEAAPPTLPPAATVRRVPDDASYAQLLELIFAADHVITW